MTPAERLKEIEISVDETIMSEWFTSKLSRQYYLWLINCVKHLTEALEKIANHKQISIDKIYLIQQCEWYQLAARKALGQDE